MGLPHTLAAWLSLLEKRHPTEIDLGLDRITAVRKILAQEKPAPCVITVAGTNGKGSTVACLDALLRAQGQDVGVYTSPHLLHFRERIRINGVPVTDAMLCDAFNRIETARGSVSLTYFEFTTLAAFDIFAGASLDTVILEVGLGGRLDAVNCVDADIAVVTRIALDHQDWLGDSLEQIAFEKAGIFRAGRPVVCGQVNPPAALASQAALLAAPWFCRGEAFDIDGHDVRRWRGQGREVGLPALQIPEDSIATALQVLSLLDWWPAADTDIGPVLKDVSVAGRFQRAEIDGKPLILDVAHNPDAALWLARRLAADGCQGRTLAVFAALADKDIAGVIAPLASLVDVWFVAELPDVARAAPAQQLADALRAAGPNNKVSVDKNPQQALARACSLAGRHDRIVVFGSFYTVGAVLALLEE